MTTRTLLRYTFTVFACLLAMHAPAQQNNPVDSLRKVAATAKGKAKVDLLNAIAMEQRRNAPDSAIAEAQKAIDIARSINFQKGVADAHLAMGAAYESKGSYDEALSNSRQATLEYNELLAGDNDMHTDLLAKKARSLINIGIIFYDKGNFDSSAQHYLSALDIATHANDSLLLSTIYNNMGNVFKVQGDYTRATEYQLKSLKIRQLTKDQNGIADSYQNLAMLCRAQGNYADALGYLRSCLQIRKSTGDKKGMGDVWNNMGNLYDGMGEYKKAIECHTKSLAVRKEIKDKSGIGASYNNIAIIYFNQGDFPQALQYFLNALQTARDIGNKKGMAKAYLNIGNIYYALGDQEEAIKYYLEDLKICQAIGDRGGISTAYLNMATVYVDREQYPEALENFRKSLVIKEELNEKEGLAIINVDLGIIFTRQKKYTEAKEFLLRAMKISGEIGDKYDLAEANIGLATIYLLTGGIAPATQCIKTGLDLSTMLGAPELLKKCYDVYAQIDSAQGRYKDAFQHYKLFIANKDSMLNDANKKKILRMQMQYEQSKKQDSIRIAHEHELSSAKIAARSKLRFWAAVSGGILLTVIVGFFFSRKVEKDKFQLEILHTRQEAVKAQLDSHFVSGTLTAINDFVENNDKKEASAYLLRFSRLVNSVLKNSFERKVTLREELNFTDDYFSLAVLLYPEKKISYSVTADSNIDIEEAIVPPMILQVAVENALKHAFLQRNEGKIEVTISKTENRLEFAICDNGSGIDQQPRDNERNRPSFGTGLAEKMMRIWNEDSGMQTFDVSTLTDDHGNKTGVCVRFTAPYITA